MGVSAQVEEVREERKEVVEDFIQALCGTGEEDGNWGMGIGY